MQHPFHEFAHADPTISQRDVLAGAHCAGEVREFVGAGLGLGEVVNEFGELFALRWNAHRRVFRLCFGGLMILTVAASPMRLL